MYRRVVCTVLWAVGVVASAQSVPEPEDLLGRIRAKMKENLTHLPDYVCSQTIERSRRGPFDADFQARDTLRLEVGLIGDRELFAWRGAPQFEEKELADMVGSGTIGNGNFALHARNVFLSAAPRFTYRGEAVFESQPALRYDYDVPLERSKYKLRVPPKEAAIAFHGTFWVNRETLDLIRLEVFADDINPGLGLARASDVMDYSRVEIGKSDFLLPRSSELVLVGQNGNASRNKTQFGDCRQYVGEASLSFGNATVDAPSGAPEKTDTAGFELPAHVLVELSLDTEIDPEKAVIGDPVRAVVARPLKEGDQVLVPEGAVVHGRLVRLDRETLPFLHYVVGLEFHTLEFGDVRTDFVATMEKAGPASGLIRQEKRLNPTFNRRRKPKLSILVREQQEGQGILHWAGKQPRIHRGLRMVWETQSLQAQAK